MSPRPLPLSASLLAASLLLGAGCSRFLTEDTGAKAACDERQPFWLDEDRDGMGTSDHVYIGCEQPEGYATEAGDCDDSDPTVVTGCADTGDTGSGDTGDTGTGDTGTGDTGDTGTGDTGTGDTGDTGTGDTGTGDTGDTGTGDTGTGDTGTGDTGDPWPPRVPMPAPLRFPGVFPLPFLPGLTPSLPAGG